MRNFRLTAASLVALTLALPAQAQTVVDILRSETNANLKAHIDAVIAAYEAEHPGVDVRIEYLANEAYKQKLPTQLQSDQRPDIFYSWGGGVLQDQAEAGLLEDITDEVAGDWAATLPESALAAFTIDGKVYGIPTTASEVVFWVNKPLAEQAGIDYTAIATWDDFLAAVEKAKAAGLTPIVAGGKDKWPLNFYWSYLAVREAGRDGFAAAIAGKGDGFAAEPFVKAGEQFQRLVELEPFQPGFMDTTHEREAGMFGDGQAVFYLSGDWIYETHKENSLSGQGIPDADLVTFRFPAVPGGAGDPTDTLGGMNGWAVAVGATPEAVDFLRFMTTPENEGKIAEQGIYIPVAKGASGKLANPYFQAMAEALAASTYHQVFLDQALGANVGATANDISADLAQGLITPEEAAATIQEEWEFR